MLFFLALLEIGWMFAGVANAILSHGGQHWLVSGLCFVAASYYADKRVMPSANILLRSKPLMRKLFKSKLTWEFVGHAKPWRPYIWHNPRWTRVRLGSQRHHLGYHSPYMYRRMLRSYTKNMRED